MRLVVGKKVLQLGVVMISYLLTGRGVLMGRGRLVRKCVLMRRSVQIWGGVMRGACFLIVRVLTLMEGF